MAVFLSTEALRSYRFLDFWRIRTHVRNAELLRSRPRVDEVRGIDNGWNEILAKDDEDPRLHITWLEAAGRRLRRTYGSVIFLIQATSYYGKLLIHPIRSGGLR